MAEAHMAVDPTPFLQRAGFEVDTNYKVPQANLSQAGLVLYLPHPRFWLRSMRRKVQRFWDKLQVAFIPCPLWAVMLFGVGAGWWALYCKATVDAVHQATPVGWALRQFFALHDPSIYDESSSRVARYVVQPLMRQVAKLPQWLRDIAAAGSFSLCCAYTMGAAQRGVLRSLLHYHGWLQRSKHNAWTKVWGLLMQYVFIRRIHNHIWAYQWCLPALPLPALNDTCAQYMAHAECTLPAEEFAAHKDELRGFLANEGPKLQRLLWVKWATSLNYVSDWWLDYVYLAGRSSLCINSNYYGIMHGSLTPSSSQAVRAAVLTHNLVRIKRSIDAGTFEPQVIAGVAPLCMAQYDYVFSTTRVPGAERDVLIKHDASESRHVVVLHKGHMYRLPVFSSAMSQLTPLQLVRAIEGILRSDDKADDAGAALLPALTTLPRTEWAMHRRRLLDDVATKQRLHIVESALFVLSLDDGASPANWSEEGKGYLCGNGTNRWADKSFNLVVNPNGRSGINGEHSWGDAPALSHVVEMCAVLDAAKDQYTADGSVAESPADVRMREQNTFEVLPAERINFRLPQDIVEAAREAVARYEPRVAALDLRVDAFRDYGKDFVSKTARCSPDAWVQMALQLAFHRDQQCFVPTYESSMTRLFRGGRTETIRSCGPESCDFVRGFEDRAVPAAEKMRLLRAACDAHQTRSAEAMCGRGCDRHLFALLVVAKGRGVAAPFLDRVFSQHWRLSTSQIPTYQVPKEQHRRTGVPEKDLQTPVGGFGPIADDGYGVCYNIWGDAFYFNVSATSTCEATDCARFFNSVQQALREMQALATEVCPAPSSPRKPKKN